MFLFKRFVVIAMTTVLAVQVTAQSSSGKEMSVEESYLQESIEIMIIREASRADSLDQKLIALEYIGEAVDQGNISTEIRQALEYLSQEGTRIIARENGRIVNNFPQIRRQAAKYLGQVGTEEAKDALIQMLQFETEPMILMEAIKSLGDIGLNKNDETIANIIRVTSRFDNTAPDNLLALATLDAFEKIARKNNGIKSSDAIRLLIRISEGPYVKPVQERARQVLADLRSGAYSGDRQ